jgi:hydroxymethylbilane synthase
LASVWRPVLIGTRGSALALWQAEYVVQQLRAAHPDREFILHRIQTRGDVDLRSPLAEMGSTGVFVKEIEGALLSGQIDLGVHSLKDLPSELDPRLTLAAVSPREDPRDALVSREKLPLAWLPAGARVGTSSPRRAAQLRAYRPDLVVQDIRGNVDTRVRKVLEGIFDAAVLAAAGLRRLNLTSSVTEYLPVSTMLPAPCQGIVGVEARAGDSEVLALTAILDDPSSSLAARSERAFVRALGGGCTTPLGAHAVMDGSTLRIDGLLATPDGARLLRDSVEGEARFPEKAGEELARRILAAGGSEILAALATAPQNDDPT